MPNLPRLSHFNRSISECRSADDGWGHIVAGVPEVFVLGEPRGALVLFLVIAGTASSGAHRHTVRTGCTLARHGRFLFSRGESSRTESAGTQATRAEPTEPGARRTQATTADAASTQARADTAATGPATEGPITARWRGVALQVGAATVKVTRVCGTSRNVMADCPTAWD